MGNIKVVEYNPQWKGEFEKARLFFNRLFLGMELIVVHVGSTAVEGLWAKPILDIDIIVPDISIRDQVIDLLTGLGYVHLGDMGVEGREAFRYDEGNPQITWMRHNLYVCLEGSDNLKNHLLLQHHLSNNKSAVKKYSLLKRELALKFPEDIDSYVDGKTELITHFLKQEGMSSNALDKISDINKNDS